MGVLTGFDAESRISVPLYHESTFSFEFAAKKLAKKLTFRKSQLFRQYVVRKIKDKIRPAFLYCQKEKLPQSDAGVG